MSKLLAIAALTLLASSAAFADDHDHDFSRDFFGSHDRHFQAPEIDAASTLTAVTLLVGGIAVIRGRKRRNDKK